MVPLFRRGTAESTAQSHGLLARGGRHGGHRPWHAYRAPGAAARAGLAHAGRFLSVCRLPQRVGGRTQKVVLDLRGRARHARDRIGRIFPVGDSTAVDPGVRDGAVQRLAWGAAGCGRTNLFCTRDVLGRRLRFTSGAAQNGSRQRGRERGGHRVRWAGGVRHGRGR